MSPFQLGRLFRRHFGESARLARDLGVSRTTISRWFRGHVVSSRIEVAAKERGGQLLAQEKQGKSAA